MTREKEGKVAMKPGLKWDPGRSVRGQKGIALVLVLVLSAMALAIMAALVYMLTARTQSSGGQKRYRNAVEAGQAGADISFAVIAGRGVFGMGGIDLAILNNGNCLTEKLNQSTYILQAGAPTNNWGTCDSSSYIDPGTPSTYDWYFDLGDAGGGQKYAVYGKIVNTVEGNSAGSRGLINGNGVASTQSGEIQVQSRPYLYTLEVDALEGGKRPEMARYSILYQY